MQHAREKKRKQIYERKKERKKGKIRSDNVIYYTLIVYFSQKKKRKKGKKGKKARKVGAMMLRIYQTQERKKQTNKKKERRKQTNKETKREKKERKKLKP